LRRLSSFESMMSCTWQHYNEAEKVNLSVCYACSTHDRHTFSQSKQQPQ
jgi:hypothetical protein